MNCEQGEIGSFLMFYFLMKLSRKGFVIPSEGGGEGEKDQRRNDKYQKKLSLSLPFSVDVNGSYGCNGTFIGLRTWCF